MKHHILYSFRRCPYCMRAHMALKYSGIRAELREVSLDDLPDELKQISSAATVPVLQLSDGTVFDESWDIVKWALEQNDPDGWLGQDGEYLLDAEILVETNDYSFKEDLDHYKYADQHPEHPASFYRQRCEEYIEELEEMLAQHDFLLSDSISLVDIAVFPYVRQFSMVDNGWFADSCYVRVRRWLQVFCDSALFQDVFQKHARWKPGDTAIFI